MDVKHAALADEQRYLDRAQELLAAMIERSEAAVAAVEAPARSGDADAAAARSHLVARLHSLRGQRGALCFGRIDQPGEGVFYIGRRHIEDRAANPVVVDWRAPVAAPFYRATAANSLDLHARRRFVTDGRELVALFEEIFDDPDHPELATGGGVPDPLLAELERSRAGELRDIVATIQAEQDAIIRAPLDRTVIVQGGPGTGKTAVGLHRAAFVLYEQRSALASGSGATLAGGQRVLVVGPNPLFLRYIGEVLPSLGETAVSQHTIETLAGSRYRVRSIDPPDVAALKGSATMARVLKNALRELIKIPTDGVRLPTAYGTALLSHAELTTLVSETLTGVSTFTAGRDVLRRRLEALILSRFSNVVTGDGPDAANLGASLRASKEFPKLLGGLWPAMSAPALVRRLLGGPTALRAAGEGLLDTAELALLRRPNAKKAEDELWSSADLPLLDEAEALINGVPATYLHVVVDEAQDLSAMALRMLGRRAPGGSLTVLGDLAQATAAGAATSWQEVAGHLGVEETAQRVDLAMGYRLPAVIIDWANRLLPEAAPGLVAAQSVRQGGREPIVLHVTDDVLIANAVDIVDQLLAEWGLLGVIAPKGLADPIREALAGAGVDVSVVDPPRLDHAVSVLTPLGAKGLEFDAALVVEPASIVRFAGSDEADTDGAGLRALYVALTRCVQELRVIHSEPLPAALR